MWAIPILWDKTTIPNIPGWFDHILKLNPLYYVDSGYRDSFMNGLWFFEHPWHTLYFWAFVLVAGLISSKVFKRLRASFLRCIIGGWNEHRKYRNRNFN